MLIVVIAVALRLAAVAVHVGQPLAGDEHDYDRIAWNIASGNGYQNGVGQHAHFTAQRGPTYVLILAGVYRVVGHNPSVPRVLQALVDCLGCVLSFLIARLLFRLTNTALISAFMYAVYPPFILSTPLLITETFVILSLMCSIYCFLAFQDSGKRSMLYASAVTGGLVALSKPVLFLLPFILSGASWREWDRKKWAGVLVTQLVVFGLIATPWVIRNQLTFNAFIPGTSNGGFTFWGASGPADGRVVGGMELPYTPKYAITAVQGMSEVQQDKWFYRDGIKVIKKHPGRYGALVAKKIVRLWFNLLHDDPPSKASQALAVFSFAAIILALVGIRRLQPPRLATLILAGLVLYFTIVHMVYFSVVRYALPVYAFMFCFSAGGATLVLERLHILRRKTQPE